MALARVVYTQSVSGNKNFTVPFPYISRDHVKVTVNGAPTSFTWINTNTVQIDPAPVVGAVVEIRRVTERRNLLVDFKDGSTITETDLDLLALQNFYLSQEADDLAEESNGIANAAASTANNAIAIANEASSKATSAVATATSAEDTANTALTNSETAISTANTALTRVASAEAAAANAANAAQSASESAATAVNTAQQLETQFNEAMAAAQQIAGADLSDFTKNSDNLAYLTDKAAARANLGLGTAATANLTTSDIDDTPGRVLKFGDFGVGSGVHITNSNLDNLNIAGFYYASNCTNTPESRGSVFVSGTLAEPVQLWVGTESGKVFVRKYQNGVGWSSWQEIYHSGNLNTANADTATKLQTARTINGTSFDGTTDITTATWGTARTITIGNTGKSVDGSANVSWSLDEIGAARFGFLANGADLNTVVTPGFYRLESNLANAPSGVDYGQLIVARGGGDTILQIATGYANGEIYWRQGNPPDVGGSGSWSQWYKFFHSGNLTLGIREEFNATGSAPVYACRAWVNFNGMGTGAIRASGNVSSITYNGTGDYTINFMMAMPDANYAAVGSCDFETGQAVNPTVMPISYSVSSVRILLNARVNSHYPQDSDLISLVVFR